MTRKLPSNPVDLLSGRHQANELAEACTLAYWMHGRDNGTALHFLNVIHKEFSDLADALGYDIARREAAAPQGAPANEVAA